MILRRLTDDSIKDFPPAFQKALHAIAKLPADAPLGKFPIDGDSIYGNVMEYDTSIEKPEKLEFHRKYVDIQAILDGRETMFWADIKNLAIRDPYLADKDVEFRIPPEKGVSKLDLLPGFFAVFYPEDGHYGKGLPLSGPAGKIRKVVVKVKL